MEENSRRFIAACDYLLENKSKNANSTRHIEHDNLKAKRDIIEKLQNIGDDLAKEEVKQLLKKLSSDFQAIGHVPYKEKDKVYEDAYKVAECINKGITMVKIREKGLESLFDEIQKIVSEKYPDKTFRITKNHLYQSNDILLLDESNLYLLNYFA